MNYQTANSNIGEPPCKRCQGLHYGSLRCPYLDEATCANCNSAIASESGSDCTSHPNRKFDNLGRVYHANCTILPSIQHHISNMSCPGDERCECNKPLTGRELVAAVAEAIYERAFDASWHGAGEAERSLWLAVAEEAIKTVRLAAERRTA